MMFAVGGLSEHYLPRPAPLFRPSGIVLAKVQQRHVDISPFSDRVGWDAMTQVIETVTLFLQVKPGKPGLVGLLTIQPS